MVEMLEVWADEAICLHPGLQVCRIDFKLLGSVDVTLYYEQPVFDTSRADPLLGKIFMRMLVRTSA
jgi:hypothetical protein